MDENVFINISFLDDQANLLIELIEKAKTKEEKLSYAKDKLTATATKYFLKGIVANSKHNNELIYIDKEYPIIRLGERKTRTNERVIDSI